VNLNDNRLRSEVNVETGKHMTNKETNYYFSVNLTALSDSVYFVKFLRIDSGSSFHLYLGFTLNESLNYYHNYFPNIN
jgi:hypothetical protein